ncbi:MAG: hypothetical protein R2704_12860 [Microthrixaceae bacterium]
MFELAQAGMVPFTGGFFAVRRDHRRGGRIAGGWVWPPCGVGRHLHLPLPPHRGRHVLGVRRRVEEGAAPAPTRAELPIPRTAIITIGLCIVGVLLIGVFPGLIGSLTRQATVVLG